ncbi:hypothetical protein LO772_13425 [Yinghuangia sp. ASG 101]|uniref:hypothetical protein n=1 Tax=Yinghuangia sp. ASG 101 TaxID=2896848 RepID=UPI001E34E641|nr:hypothetical protein [Yinghuangia sp. ASG 101]UGQ14492.1 hypothetical protein LO772_13425 [Yinghuangia sp. ASG 101]
MGRAVWGLLVTQFDAVTRARRWELFREAFPDIDALRVVDLGGSEEFWRHAPVRPAHVVVVSASGTPGTVLPWLDVATGDPVAHTGRYDVAVCDQLPSHAPESAATAVRRCAARYWVRSASLGHAELRRLFPDAVLRRERRGAVTVSRIAAKPR